jgi:biotin carboxylase
MVNGYLVILGGNTMTIPAIEQLEKSGFKTLVVDKKPCNDSYKIASKVIEADIYSSEETEAAITNFDISGIIPLNDFAVKTASILSEKRNLPCVNSNSVENVISKASMKKKWKEAGLLTADYKKFILDDLLVKKDLDWNIFPAVVKPGFAGGASRGVFKVENKNEVILKINESRKFYLNDEVVIEEFIEGTEHTVEVLIYNYNTKILSISDKENYSFSATVVQKLYFPGPKGNLFRTEIEALVDKACKALDLKFGCAHFEIMITEDEKIYLLEVGGRPGGGLNFFPIGYLSTGYHYPLELARIMTGREPLLNKNDETFQLGWYFWEVPDGVLRKVVGFEEVAGHPNVVASEMLKKSGDLLNSNFKNDMERPGYFLVKGKTKQEVDEIIKSLQDKVKFVVN